MASVPGNTGLPMLYQNLVPLSSQEHVNWKMRPLTSLDFIANVHAIPITVDEFGLAQRFYPIIFSAGPDAVPLALMGLNEGVNVFVKEDGTFPPNTYLPAFIRRYPFLLAKLRDNNDELSLCFDPTLGLVGDFEEGQRLFTDDGQVAQPVTDALGFCEQFEMAAQRTTGFVKELADLDLLDDGEVTIQQQNGQPYTYRGFRMINEEKMRELRGDQLRKMNQNGMLILLHAHLFSLQLVSEIFARQMEQGKVPPQSQLNA